MSDGRSTFYWKERISAAWGKYFGTYEKFLHSACGLEFLLEFNSYLGTNAINDPKVKEWGSNGKDRSFYYVPDLFAYDLRWTVPTAERLYDLIAGDKAFPPYLAVDAALLELAFKGKNREDRLLTYGGFLHHLKAWQETFMFQHLQRWPFMYTWQGRLGTIVESYHAERPKKF